MTVPAETVLVSWLTTAFPTAWVATEVPANLAGSLPCIRVLRIGGADEEIPTFDNPTMTFDCFAATRDAARTLAYNVQSSLRRDFPGRMVAGAAILRSRTISGPAWAAWDNTNLRRFIYIAEFRIQS